jgi:hypothetical protein
MTTESTFDALVIDSYDTRAGDSETNRLDGFYDAAALDAGPDGVVATLAAAAEPADVKLAA